LRDSLDIKKTNIKAISSTLNESGCKEFFYLIFARIGLIAIRFNFSNLKKKARIG